MHSTCPRCGLFHPTGAPCLALHLSATPTAGLPPGTLLAGRYRIERVIHRGGMSIVYLAEDTLLQGRAVALKELRPRDEAGPEELREAEAWFARESALLSVLRHPLIPAFYSVFREEGRSYIAQEYVAGENLDDLVRRQGPVDPDQVAEWGCAVCGLLEYLHGLPEPVIFRDFKPANILLRANWSAPDRRLAVVDFGIARPFLEGNVGTVIGTPGYAPPEQYQGLATPRSDVYALGATLHRLLTAHDPEHGAPFTFPPVQDLNPSVSPELATVVECATSLDPAARYRDAADLREALDTARGEAEPPRWAARGRRRDHHRRLLGVVAALLVVPMLLSQSLASLQSMRGRGSEWDGEYSPVMGACVSGASVIVSTASIGPAAPSCGQQMLEIDLPPDAGSLIPFKGACTPTVVGGQPNSTITCGPDGSLWYLEPHSSTLVRRAQDGSISTFPTTFSDYTQVQNIAAGPATCHCLWLAGDAPTIVRMDINADTFTPYYLPVDDSQVSAITPAADGALWFALETPGQVGRIGSDGAITIFNLPSGTSPEGITVGPDGNIWFTDDRRSTGWVGRLTPGGSLKEWRIPTPNSTPGSIIAGSDGNLWFSEENGNRIGRITPSGAITEYPLPTPGRQPEGIVAGADGAIWFAEYQSDSIGRLPVVGPSAGKVSEYTLPPGSHPYGLALGPAGSVWWEGESVGAIGSDGTAPARTPRPTISSAAQGNAPWSDYIVGSP